MEKYFYFDYGFYIKSIHGDTIPQNAIEIPKDYYFSLISGQSTDKQIAEDENGYPILIDRVVQQEVIVQNERNWRNTELLRADIELNKVQDGDPKSVGAVGDWRTYRKALRALPEHPLFPSIEARPTAPDA